MYVVNFLHAFDGEHRARHFFNMHFARTPFQQNVGGLAQNSDAGPENEKADGEPGNAEGGNIGEIVDGVIEKSDGAAEEAANNFGDDQAERGEHGPAEYGGF